MKERSLQPWDSSSMMYITRKLAMGIPCHPDYRKQEDEILTHLAKLTRDKRNDTV